MKEIFLKGGPLMYVILVFSIMGLAIIIEKLIYFFSTEKGDHQKLRVQLKEYVNKKDINGAKAVCSLSRNSVSRVLAVILDNANQTRKVLEEKVKEVVLEQVTLLERFMWILKITATVTPLVGLLGTVMGMIKAFNVIAAQGVGNPEMLAGGISMALITTAAGLSVAIPAFVLYHYFDKKIDNTISEMEKASVEFLNILGR